MSYFTLGLGPILLIYLSFLRASRRGNLEKAEEVLRRRGGERLVRHLALLRDETSDITHVRRFIGLGAIRDGRQRRPIGLDQQPRQRHATRDVLHVRRALERDDARQRDVKV